MLAARGGSARTQPLKERGARRTPWSVERERAGARFWHTSWRRSRWRLRLLAARASSCTTCPQGTATRARTTALEGWCRTSKECFHTASVFTPQRPTGLVHPCTPVPCTTPAGRMMRRQPTSSSYRHFRKICAQAVKYAQMLHQPTVRIAALLRCLLDYSRWLAAMRARAAWTRTMAPTTWSSRANRASPLIDARISRWRTPTRALEKLCASQSSKRETTAGQERTARDSGARCPGPAWCT